jgi:hypothetical protein
MIIGIHIDKQRSMEGFVKYAAEMVSGAMIRIPDFINHVF